MKNNLNSILLKSLVVINLVAAAAAMFYTSNALAYDVSGKLLLTGGVTQIEGAGGGGLTPWAFIGTYATEDQIGVNAFHTSVVSTDYALDSTGIMVGLYDLVEISYARQVFNTKEVGGVLGSIGLPANNYYRINQNILGLKIKVVGDGVFAQDSWLPQIAVGAFYKRNEASAVVLGAGATSDNGTDVYIAASKIILDQSLLYDVTLRGTKANQMGLVGFGGNVNDSYKLMLEGSLAYLFTREFAGGVEYRQKPNNLNAAGQKEDSWADIFVAWAPSKNISLTAAYAQLGSIVTRDNQNSLYTSIQIGF